MPIKPRRIELLSPAKDLNCGIEAINHGADAMYIGAPKFGARAAAGNSLDDIRALCEHAHLYNARIYVALNTILREEELPEAEKTDMGSLSGRCRRPDCAGYGDYPSEPAADPFACQYPDG